MSQGAHIRKLAGKNTSYFFWRITYIAIKPLAIIFAAKFLDTSTASLMSVAVMVSSTLMASLSFGTYRLLFRADNQTLQIEGAEEIRKGTFILNGIIVCLFGLVAATIFDFRSAAFVTVFVLTEHLIHDESRILLYTGSREKWARENCVRTVFILAIPSLSFLSGENLSALSALLIVATCNAAISAKRGGLLNIRAHSFKILLKHRFYKIYCHQFNYFASATLNRLNQQSDRLLYSLISFETLWLYTLVAQAGNLPLMFFEMSEMSKLKESVARQRHLQRFQWLSRPQLLRMSSVSLLAVFTYVFLGYTTPELFEPLLMYLFLFILAVNYIAAASMYNGEKLFWALNDAKRFRRLETLAFGAGLVAFFPATIFGTTALANTPKALSLITRLWNSYKWLRY